MLIDCPVLSDDMPTYTEAAILLIARQAMHAWILTDTNKWVPNPFYVGPPVLHPDDGAVELTDIDASVNPFGAGS
jgi:hypothetical protein